MKDIKRILRYIFPYKWNAIANISFNTLSTLFALVSFVSVIPFLDILFGDESVVIPTALMPWELNQDVLTNNMQFYIGSVKESMGQAATLLIIGMGLAVATFGKTIFWYLAEYNLVPIRNGVVRDIRNKLYKKILSLHVGYFSDEKKGNIISRMTNDVQEIDFSIMSSLTMLTRDPIKIIVYLGAMIKMNLNLTLFVLLVLPSSGLIIGRIGKTLRKRSADGQQRLGTLMSIIEESIFGLQIIKAFNAEKIQDSRFQEVNEGYTGVMNKINRKRALASPISEFLATITMVFVMWYGGKIIFDNGTLRSSELIAYLVIFSQIITPVKSLSQATYNIRKGLASVDRVNQILDVENKIVEPEKPVEKITFSKGIQYKDINFSYVDTPVLKNVNLNIGLGKTIALVGQSGSGKTTMADLLPRFYDLEHGEILIDGINIKDFKLKDLRSLIGYVNQSPILFNDTFTNNIKFGIEDATDEQVIEAAKIANAHEFIMESEHGYETNIGDGGSKLSGGQRQRLSIARAILKNPPIMILDEATSALDTESEKLVQQALDNLMKDRTSIVIAHRLSTIKNADEICVMQHGEIIEQGKHEDLIKTEGVYSKLYNMQIQ